MCLHLNRDTASAHTRPKMHSESLPASRVRSIWPYAEYKASNSNEFSTQGDIGMESETQWVCCSSIVGLTSSVDMNYGIFLLGRS
jgi:hypothetical protein